MRLIKIFILMGVVFFFSTGASIIDNETKTTVSKLSGKLDHLVQLEQTWNKENATILREQKESIQRLITRTDAISGRLDAIKARIDAMENPVAQMPAVEPTPVIKPTPVVTAPSTFVVSRVEPTPSRLLAPSKIFPLLPYIVSGTSLTLLVALFVRMRRGEAELRRKLWRNDVDALRDDLPYESPSTIPPNPKVHVTGEFRRSRLP